MSGPDISSSNQDISVKAGAKKRNFNPNDVLKGMTKDTKKRWMIVLAVTVGGLVFLTSSMSGKSKAPATPQRTDPAVVDTSPRGLSSQKDWRAQTGSDIEKLRQENASFRAAQAETNAQIARLLKTLEDNKKNPAPQQSPDTRVNLSLPPPPTPPRSVAQPPVVPAQPTVSAPLSAPPPPPAAKATPEAPKVPARSPARAFIPKSNVSANSAGTAATEEMVPNERKGFLPGGSFAAATLISGVEAFTGGTAQSQPQPIVVRLDANAILPNAANYQIKGCHVLASVWGDMSSERVFGRLATLTCVDAQNRLVLSEEVEGVLVDSDGKNGIRGSLQDRQGAKLARSLLAGFAQGVSSAFGAAQSTVSTTALGATTQIMPGNVGRAGAYQGAATAAEQLSEFYLKQAESTMPIIAVDAGRKVSVLFTKSKALKFETTDSYKNTTKDKLHVERKVD